MNFKIMHDAKEIEKLREEAYNKKAQAIDSEIESFYEKQINRDKILPIGGYVNNELVAGIYISTLLNSLYIEQLFVKEEYRHKGYGTQMVKFVIDNKDIIEKHFKMNLEFSKAEISNDNALKLVQNLGYHKISDVYGTYRKRL